MDNIRSVRNSLQLSKQTPFSTVDFFYDRNAVESPIRRDLVICFLLAVSHHGFPTMFYPSPFLPITYRFAAVQSP